jgi:hypothetical protein
LEFLTVPRIRTIKPEFWRDDALSKVSAEAALLAIGLLNHADDDGYFNANPKLIEADIFPLRELSGSVTGMVQELAGIGYIKLFSVPDGRRYGCIANFDKHQVINKKNPSKIKELCTIPEDYGSPTVALPVGKERKGKEKEGEKEQGKRFAPFDPPEWINREHWDAWHSCAKRRKASAAQKQLAVDKLSKWRSEGLDHAGALENAAVGGYQGLFLPDRPGGVLSPKPQALTVQAKPGPDPALAKIEADAKNAAPMPEQVKAKLAELRLARSV